MNVKINYLYRDAGNYKLFGHEVFLNPDSLPIEEVERKIRSALIDGEYFDPVQWKMPILRFSEWNNDLDHFWNEFESVEETDEEVQKGRSLTELFYLVIS